MFVGNIPYDVTEEQLVNLFRQFGEIQRFRLQLDNGGKGKGYGFCDFVTVESAEKAKGMNNFISINGRQLRVDSASQPSGNNMVQPSSKAAVSTASAAAAATTTTTSYHTTSKAAKELDDALKQLTYGEAYHILEEVRVWIKRDPDGARELLQEKPSLANALLKMNMLMAGLVNSPPADMPFGMVPPPSHNAQQPPQLPGVDQNLIDTILGLTEAQVAALRPAEQSQVRQIRELYRHKG